MEREVFSHRENIDPIGYEVGIFYINGNSRTLVLKTSTEDIMEYFYDDRSDDEFIDIEFVIQHRLNNFKNSFKGLYFITKEGNIKNRYNLSVNFKPSKRNPYSRSILHINSFKICFTLHRILAILFIPNPYPEKYNIINHKNMNKSDNCLSNLEWSSASLNNLSTNRKSTSDKGYVYYQYNKSGKLLRIFNSTEEVRSFYPGYRKCLDNGKYKNGFRFERLNKNVLDYLKEHPIVENGWYVNKFITTHRVEANLCGVLRINGKLTIGTLEKPALTYRVKLNKKSILVHRLVYETISGSKIPEEMVIDHIHRVSKENGINNEYSNLRLCSSKENMNNPETLVIMGISCRIIDINSGNIVKKFISKKDARNYLNTPKVFNYNYFVLKQNKNQLFIVDSILDQLPNILKKLKENPSKN